MKATALGLGCFAASLTNVSGFVSQFRSTGVGSRFGPHAPFASESSTLRMKKGATDHVSVALMFLLSLDVTFANVVVERWISRRAFCIVGENIFARRMSATGCLAYTCSCSPERNRVSSNRVDGYFAPRAL